MLVIGLSHLPQFDHDCNRGFHREGIGIIVTDLIRSYHIMMSIVAIGLIVIKLLTAKIFSTINPIDKSIVFITSDRTCVIHHNKSQQIESTRAPQSRLSQRIVDKEGTTMWYTISYDMLPFVAMYCSRSNMIGI